LTQSAISFGQTDNGRERTTDGLWSHRGTLRLGPQNHNGTGVVQGVINGQLVVQGSPPALNNASYSQGQLMLLATSPAVPMLGFHELNSSALALYKQQGSSSVLRVRGNDGTDYPLVGAPGSVQKHIVAWSAASSWATPGAGWTESDIHLNGTCTGVECRVEFSCAGSNNLANAATFIGLGIDSSLSLTMGVIQFSTAGQISPISGVWYVTPIPGSRRFGIFVNPSSGRWTFDGSTTAQLHVTEQRA
jgi:hypothetical protein